MGALVTVIISVTVISFIGWRLHAANATLKCILHEESRWPMHSMEIATNISTELTPASDPDRLACRQRTKLDWIAQAEPAPHHASLLNAGLRFKDRDSYIGHYQRDKRN